MGVILGATIGTVLLLITVVVLCVYCLYWRRRRRKNSALLTKQTESIQLKSIQERQKDDDNFFRTRACEEAEIELKSSNILTLIGNSGSGKTAIAQHIAFSYHRQGYHVIYTDTFEDIKLKINPREMQVFLLNDPVGKECLDEMLERNMKKYEESTLTLLKNTNIKLLFTCRKAVFTDARLRCKLLTSCTVDIDGPMLNLSNDEKKAILGKKLELSKINKEELSEILTIDRYFPLLCYLYGNNERYRYETAVEFFKGFHNIILEEIQYFKDNDKGKFCALVFLSVFEYGLEDKQLTDIDQECSEIVHEVYELCGFKTDSSGSLLLQQFLALDGSYVKKVGTVYTFLHDYMMEVTTFVVGTTYPHFLIQHCPSSFLRIRLVFKTQKSNEKSQSENKKDLVVELDEIHAIVLVERFMNEIRKGNCIDVFLCPCFRHECVIAEFISKLDDNLMYNLIKLHSYGKKSLCLNLDEELTFTKLDFFFWRKQASPLHFLVIYSNDVVVRAVCNVVDASELQQYELFSASCASGNLDLIKYFTDKLGSCANEKWNGELDPLQIAAIFNYEKVIKFLLKRGNNDVNCLCHGWSPLTLACLFRFNNIKENQISSVQTLIENNADVNLCNSDGASPLYCAAKAGYGSIVKILLSNKADINMCNKNKSSPLYIAAQNNHYAVVSLLLENKADVNKRKNTGASPLYIAAKNGHESVVKLLMDKKADANICDNDGYGPLYKAAMKGHDCVVKILLHNNVDINTCYKNGASPLYVAAQNGHESVVNVLLDNKTSVDMCNKSGVSPLYIASHNGHESVVKILLDNKAEVNMCNKNGASPLYIAAESGHDSVVRILLDKKANVNMCNKKGVSPLYIAAQNGHYSVVKILLNNEADVNIRNKNGASPLFIAAQNGRDSIVVLLLDFKANINMCNNDGVSPLYIAGENGRDSIVKILLDNYADVNIRNKNDTSPLCVAAQKGRYFVVKILLDNEADVNLCDKEGNTPLHLAAQEGHESVVKILLDYKAGVNNLNKSGASPLYIAAQNGNDCIVEMLLDRKADVNWCDS